MSIENAQKNEIAAKIISREVSKMLQAWTIIYSTDRSFPEAPVGRSWDSLKWVRDEMSFMITEWDKEDGC